MSQRVIVLIEDQEDLLELITLALQLNGGADVRAFIDPLHALRDEVWRDADIALIDYQLGGNITGLDVARWVLDHGHPVRLFITTAWTLATDVTDELRRLGIGLIPKPYGHVNALRLQLGLEPYG